MYTCACVSVFDDFLRTLTTKTRHRIRNRDLIRKQMPALFTSETSFISIMHDFSFFFALLFGLVVDARSSSLECITANVPTEGDWRSSNIDTGISFIYGCFFFFSSSFLVCFFSCLVSLNLTLRSYICFLFFFEPDLLLFFSHKFHLRFDQTGYFLMFCLTFHVCEGGGGGGEE